MCVCVCVCCVREVSLFFCARSHAGLRTLVAPKPMSEKTKGGKRGGKEPHLEVVALRSTTAHVPWQKKLINKKRATPRGRRS